MLSDGGAEAIIHCGDVGGVEVLEELAGWRCWFVWGNSDFPPPDLKPYLESLGLSWPDGPLDLTICGKKVAVFHGHEYGFQEALQAARHDYLFHGHTHQRRSERNGNMRIINPGALHRVQLPTVALLDLDHDHLKFLELNSHARLK